jgi:ADP-ribose pyrophosphatase YjhB (NUDIX family)
MPRRVIKASEERRYPTRPFVSVGIIIWRGDKVLLIQRGKPPRQGDWSLPGGMQDIGETIMETAVREACEETGLAITPLGIVTTIDNIIRDADGKVEYHYTMVDVAAEANEGKATAGDDALDVHWATMDEVEQLCSWPEIARVVRLSALERVL